MNYNFVPLVTRDLELICAVEILYLRYGDPGQVLTMTGDLDNRLKTLFDALRMPTNASELGSFVAPSVDEQPFFCLLEDDLVITERRRKAIFYWQAPIRLIRTMLMSLSPFGFARVALPPRTWGFLDGRRFLSR